MVADVENILTRVREIALKYALINALEHEQAQPKYVLKKIFVDEPRARQLMRDPETRERIVKIVEDACAEVNRMPAEQREVVLGQRFGITLEQIYLERARRGRVGLPPLPGAQKGKVVTRFAPAPSGALHIGHILRAALIPWFYARMYEGKFILRIEDTDPRRIKKVYYDWIVEDLKAVGIDWDELIYESDHFELYYRVAEELFRRGKAYVCFCTREEFKKYKEEKRPCPHRDKCSDPTYWEKFVGGEYREGQAVVRLKTDMSHPNPALRDPPLLRIIETVPHPRTGYKYRVYPLYNFACAVEDHESGITHVLRAKEHEVNEYVQRAIFDALGWKPPVYIQYGMLLIEGMELHKRHIREKLKRGELKTWADTGLPTVRALLRQGIHPQALKMMAFHVGLSLRDARISLEALYRFNRQVLSQIAKRLFFVEKPAWILRVRGAPERLTARIPWNPEKPDEGHRVYHLTSRVVDGERVLEVYISHRDVPLLRDLASSNQLVRLKGLATVRVRHVNDAQQVVETEFVAKDLVAPGIQIIHWVPTGDLAIDAFVETPQGELQGYVELMASFLEPGTYVQLERFGWGRLVDNQGEVVRFAIAHP